MTPILFICSDELNRDYLGCSGNEVIQTPNLDALARRGTRFTAAYTPSPICGPARTSLATGLHVHQHEMWDSAAPYDGSIPSWGHRLRDAGYKVASVGKLHYRSSADDNGFDEEHLATHATDGVGWIRGLLRSEPAILTEACATYARDVGPGESSYVDYDRTITERACRWIRDTADADRPWALFVSFMAPHFPLIAPSDFYDRYSPAELAEAAGYDPSQCPDHPVIETIASVLNYGHSFDDEHLGRALAGYYGLCSFLDHNVGELLGALEEVDPDGQTLVLFTSDHGDMLGEHGLWAKSYMYEGSVGVPMMLAGPGVPEGSVVDTPVSLVDCLPTFLQAAQIPNDTTDLAGDSLLEVISAGDSDRAVLSEYHDGASPSGIFMLRTPRWKYVHYVGHAPQLFDLRTDPREHVDLASSLNHANVRHRLEQRLRAIVDVDAANQRAFEDQRRRIDEFGGVDAVRNWSDFGYTPTPVD